MTVTMAEIAAAYPALAAVATATQRTAVDPDTATWLDAPGLARWIRREGLYPRLPTSQKRTVRRWEGLSAAAAVSAADRVLTAVGRSLHEIPEELWVPFPGRDMGRNRRVGQAEAVRRLSILNADRDRALREYADRKRALAEELGVTVRTLHNWKQAHERQPE